MADIMLKDLETDQELDYKALAKLIGGHGRYGKKYFRHYASHYWHNHYGHRGKGYGHWKKYYRNSWNYYKRHYS
jgi:hypothetical protein